jgi:hypothetical protein
MTSKCVKTMCDEAYIKKQQNIFQKIRKGFVAEIVKKEGKNTVAKKTRNKTKKSNYERKAIIDSCSQQYCNPTCKNTLFQKKSDIKHEILLSVRESTLGKKENIIKNGFYEKLPSHIVKNLKKKGALSACKSL